MLEFYYIVLSLDIFYVLGIGVYFLAMDDFLIVLH